MLLVCFEGRGSCITWNAGMGLRHYLRIEVDMQTGDLFKESALVQVSWDGTSPRLHIGQLSRPFGWFGVRLFISQCLKANFIAGTFSAPKQVIMMDLHTLAHADYPNSMLCLPQITGIALPDRLCSL